ncbi:MAG: hypothetical protein K9N46_15905 [Candidatus Marinimicrobia bacterium]|nr:hypothetical protein [Candidatus Neomarinimicrobiota bacterium]MCF7830139.1 hypothetical protein [Candidatus Neomarinimicrobiota bacterium]MCF7882216.1 hypothetical protein [Candidatus Neomarinimicrobiota bacterium]
MEGSRKGTLGSNQTRSLGSIPSGFGAGRINLQAAGIAPNGKITLKTLKGLSVDVEKSRRRPLTASVAVCLMI